MSANSDMYNLALTEMNIIRPKSRLYNKPSLNAVFVGKLFILV